MRLRRIHDAPAPDDGRRILVDRLWPRGISKERAALDLWAKDLAPSDTLRKAYHAGELDFELFAALYRDELDGADLAPLGGDVTLLTAAKIPEQSHLAVLRDLLGR